MKEHKPPPPPRRSLPHLSPAHFPGTLWTPGSLVCITQSRMDGFPGPPGCMSTPDLTPRSTPPASRSRALLGGSGLRADRPRTRKAHRWSVKVPPAAGLEVRGQEPRGAHRETDKWATGPRPYSLPPPLSFLSSWGRTQSWLDSWATFLFLFSFLGLLDLEQVFFPSVPTAKLFLLPLLQASSSQTHTRMGETGSLPTNVSPRSPGNQQPPAAPPGTQGKEHAGAALW